MMILSELFDWRANCNKSLALLPNTTIGVYELCQTFLI